MNNDDNDSGDGDVGSGGTTINAFVAEHHKQRNIPQDTILSISTFHPSIPPQSHSFRSV
jgi:hypothetical protein